MTAKEYFRSHEGAIKAIYALMSILNSPRLSSQVKNLVLSNIEKLQFDVLANDAETLRLDKHILRLQVLVNYAILVQMRQLTQQLECNLPYLFLREDGPHVG